MAKIKHSKADLDVCKGMYMDNIPVAKISEEMRIPRPTLQYYVKKSWQRERDLKNSRMLKEISSGRIEDLNLMQGTALKVLNRTLSSLANRGKEPTTQEAMHVTKILETVHKLLDYDKQADKEPIDLNPAEAIQEINNDPFLGGE